MEQTKNGSGLEAGGQATNVQPGNQVISTSVDVSPQLGGQQNNVNRPAQPPPPPPAYAAVGAIPNNQMYMGHNPPPVQNVYRERERDRIPIGQPGQLAPPPGPPVINSAQQRYGEWDCPGCNGHNYVNRVDCFKCGMVKPLDAKAKRPGDWYCIGCSAHNYASRDLCFRCQKGKPAGMESVTYGGNRRPGDWDCPSCKAHNYASREACYRCQIPKPPGLPVVVGSRRPGDWDCSQCHAHNYASRTACFKCQTQKPRPAVPPPLPLPMYTQLQPQYPWPPMLPMMHHVPYPQPHMMLPQQPPPPLGKRPSHLVQLPQP